MSNQYKTLVTRQEERRKLTRDQYAIFKEINEYSHQIGARSNGIEWIAVPKNLLISLVSLIRELRKVE